MRKVLLLSMLVLSLCVQAKETKTIEVPNCWAKARELAKTGTNIRKNEYGNDVVKTYLVSFDTKTHVYTLSCDQYKDRDQWMRIEKWSVEEMNRVKNESKKEIDKLAKQVGM